MGCSFSGLDALYGTVGSGAEVWVNKRRFRIQRQLGEEGSTSVYVVREQPGAKKDTSFVSGVFLYIHSGLLPT